ncbi:hypothetical protein BK133_26680 [Paenibacillus sp. FSL H8-0548]|uniref:hypothetical protein n=1 Tax=Paenibacillus sp. FSL H8-0548 TaxID=1920422 RepID=UPI00096F698A|nr:hypothetical protein [Paenibacillus sp. FSL H8-0548]OMF22226.1 hypothetical protein BK133_26680 [Paenibacillus sp. FSL H8-0548]
MLAVVCIVTLSVLVAIIEAPRLIKRRLKKETIVYFICLGVAALLSSGQGLKLNMPNPLDWITFVYKPLSDALFRMIN